MGIEQSGTRTTPRMDLGVAFQEFVANQAMYIGMSALARFNTQKKDGVFPGITRESVTRSVDTKRAKRANYNRVSLITKEYSFSCEDHGLEGALDDSERALYASDFDAELATTMQIANLVLLAQEIRIATALFNTATWTGAAYYTDNSADPWDSASSDPVGQVAAAKEKVRVLTGLEPNALIFSKAQLENLKKNSDIKDRIKYTARVTEAAIINALADLFGVDNILIGRAVKNTANKGKTFSGSDVWSDDYAMVARVATDQNSLAEPCVGRSMLWVADSPENQTVEEYRDEPVRSDVFRVRQNVDEVVIDKSFAHLIKIDA